ncbi:MAG: ABC transporter ATP-binding protein [Bacillota bacterium]|nr:ABC transporter ATP-binding protein [Bacillota bacterium]
MNEMNAIEVRNMSKSFKTQHDKANTLKEYLVFGWKKKKNVHEVLRNINVDIKKGETVALIGTNGSGKSTLLKLMTKIIYPTKGTIETSGKLTSLLELGAGFHPDFTGRENIYFNASIFGLTRKEIDQRVDQIIEFSELGDFIDDPIRTYSSGMYMRLAFSVAINVDADILLIDEILAVGDQHFQEKCYAKLEELRDSSRTIVIVTHSLEVVKQLCNRAIWIYKGDFKLDGDPGYVIGEYLNQISIDHNEKRKKAQADGTFKYQGSLCIDYPISCSQMSKENDSVLCQGWELSDCEDSRFEVLIDGKEFTEIERYRRDDVYHAFSETYPGYLDVNTLGWRCYIPLSSLEVGSHKLVCRNYESNGILLDEKSVEFQVL